MGEDSFKRKSKANAVNDFVSSSENERKVVRRGHKKGTIPSSTSLETWIELLPKVPSHYCRASSTKIYMSNLLFGLRGTYMKFGALKISKNVQCEKIPQPPYVRKI